VAVDDIAAIGDDVRSIVERNSPAFHLETAAHAKEK
jgi:hypothetical protein